MSATLDPQAISTTKPPLAGTARLVVSADRFIYRVARHWLLIVNGVFLFHFATLLLAPVFEAWGHASLARPIYAYNGLFCHQRDDRSFHILGHKMACCERCAAIYCAIVLTGLAFAFLRGRVRSPRVVELLALAAPVAIDGTAQLVGIWHSTMLSRVATGTLLGVAICWFLLPYLEQGFMRIRTQLETLFARLVAEGRAQPL